MENRLGLSLKFSELFRFPGPLTVLIMSSLKYLPVLSKSMHRKFFLSYWLLNQFQMNS